MSRIKKRRLDYFPLNTDFIHDRLVRRIMKREGDGSFAILLGALSCFFNLPLDRRDHYFCSQFVAGLLRDSGALELSKPPALVRPADFCQIHQLRTVHQGDMGGLPALALA